MYKKTSYGRLNRHLFELRPTSITILTTFRCSAMCTECSLRCSPYDESPLLKSKQIKSYIGPILKDFSSIRIVVFTGGEPFLLGDELVKSIKYVKENGLLSRIVSNGYWAKSGEITRERLGELRAAGLHEINFSTGDEHSQFVPIDNIVNACIESAKLNMLALVNIESHLSSRVNSETIMSHHKLRDFLSKKTRKDEIH